MVSFLVTLSDPKRRFQCHGDALDELCAQLTRDLFAIAKFLYYISVAVTWYRVRGTEYVIPTIFEVLL